MLVASLLKPLHLSETDILCRFSRSIDLIFDNLKDPLFCPVVESAGPLRLESPRCGETSWTLPFWRLFRISV